MPMKAHDHRRKELAVIHILAKQLGLDRETYEQMLFALTRKTSSGALDDAERQAVIKHMESRGGVTTASRRRASGGDQRTGKPLVTADKQALVNKLEALLNEGARPWNYARAMAKRMFRVDQLEWATAAQLHSLVAALEYQKRRGWAGRHSSDRHDA